MAVYQRPAILLVGPDGKPSHLGAIIRFKALNIEKLTGKSLPQLLEEYEHGEGRISIQFDIVDIVTSQQE